MKTAILQDMSLQQLIDRFIEIGVEQDHALLVDEVTDYNRLFKEKTTIVAELKGRVGDQRHALLQLYRHPNMQVQLNAAIATLAISPQSARQVLRAIEASRMPNHALRAGMTLAALDEGTFKPA
jgi:hypothetical protein